MLSSRYSAMSDAVAHRIDAGTPMRAAIACSYSTAAAASSSKCWPHAQHARTRIREPAARRRTAHSATSGIESRASVQMLAQRVGQTQSASGCVPDEPERHAGIGRMEERALTFDDVQ